MEDLRKNLTNLGYQVAGADNHIKSRDSRIAQTPIKDVEWSGARGASRCTPTDLESQKILAQYKQTHVFYDWSGEPDFRPFETLHVKISDMSDSRQRNFSSAEKKLLQTDWAKENNIHSVSDMQKYRQEHNLTWHECSDGVTLRLIPTEINSRYGHAGGVSETGALNEAINIKKDGFIRSAGKIHGQTAIKTNQAIVEADKNIYETREKIKQGVENIDVMKPVISVTGVVEDYGRDFTIGAVESVGNAAFPLMVLGVQNICEVASGQKSMEEARNEMVQETAGVAIRGGRGRIAEKAISELAEKTGSELLGFISKNSSGVVQVANVGILVFKSFNKLINDEISGVEFFDEIGEQGVGLLGDFIGTLAGAGIADMLIPATMATGPAGILVGAAAFVGGMIISTVCVSIYRNTINLRDKYRAMGTAYRHRIAELNGVIDMAIKEMEYQQVQLSSMIKNEYAEWDNKFNSGFQAILGAMLNNNFEQLSDGLNQILGVFGEAVLFNNMEEFDGFFFDDNAVLTL